MNNINDIPNSNPPTTPNAANQLTRINSNDPRYKLALIMNRIFDENKKIFIDFRNSKFSPELNYVMVYFETLQAHLPLTSLRAEKLEDLTNIINNLDASSHMANNIKTILSYLNSSYKNEKIDEMLVNAKTIYTIACFKFFVNNIGFYNRKNDLLFNNLMALTKEISQETDLEIKIEKFISSFKNIFESSLKMIFSEGFSETSQMDLKGLFQILNLCNINISETSLYKYLSRKITEKNKNSFNFVFNELIKAYNSVSQKLKFNNNIVTLRLPTNYSFLNLELLKTINNIPYFKENFTNLPFNLDITILSHLTPTDFQNNSSSLEHILKLRNPNEDFLAKFAFVKSCYLDKYSSEQIIQDKIYRPIIEYLMNSNVTQIDLQFLIFDLMPYYSLDLIQDLFIPSSSSNFVREIFQQLNADQIQNFASYAAYQNGYTFEIARFIDNFNLFSDNERINFLLSSKPFVIETFLSSYSKFIPLNPINSESIFIKFIELFKHKVISANIMTKVFDWIDSINDVNTSEELMNQYCKMLIDAFQLDGLNLIPQNVFHYELALNLFSRLKSMGCQIPEINDTKKVLKFCKDYISEDSTFNPSKLSLLPAEIKYHIGSFLRPEDLKSLEVCNKADSGIYKELYDIKRNNNILKILFKNLFPEFNLDDERASFRTFFVKTTLNPKTLQLAEELFEKLNSNQILSLCDEKIFLNIILKLFSENFRSDSVKFDDMIVDGISNTLHEKQAIFQMINQVFAMDERRNTSLQTSILLILYKADIELPSILIDNLFEYPRKISNFFDFLIKNNELKLNKFFNMYFLEKWLHTGSPKSELFNLYFALTGKFNDIDFIKKLFRNSLIDASAILNANLPKDINWRLDLAKQVITPTSYYTASYYIVDPFMKFLSFNGNNWTEDQIIEMANLFPLKFMMYCLEPKLELKYGFSLNCYPKEKVLKFVEQVFKDYGYQKLFHNYCRRLKLKISNETIFKFGIHNNTDFKDLRSKFSTILKKQKLKLDFKDIKSIMEVYCKSICPKNTRFEKYIDFFTDILKLTANQKVEIFTMILETMKLKSLTAMAKTNIFNDIARTNDELFTSIIQNMILNDDEAKTNFTGSIKAIKELVGVENANRLRNSINKRKTRPGKTASEPRAKRRKK